MRVAHLAVEFRLRYESRDGVNHENVDRAGFYQNVGNLEGLFAGIRLRDQEVVNVDAQLPGVCRIERVFCINEGRTAALSLSFRDDLKCNGSFARGLGSEYFDHATAGHAAHAERGIEADRAGGDCRNGLDLARAEAHD